MPIDNAVLLRFCDETIRPMADRLGGLLPTLPPILAAVTGQGIAELLGTTDAELQRASAWEPADYGAVTADTIFDSDSGARTLLSNRDVIALLRVFVVLSGMVAANPQLLPLVGKIAVNPRI